jgi:hypothetical protein
MRLPRDTARHSEIKKKKNAPLKHVCYVIDCTVGSPVILVVGGFSFLSKMFFVLLFTLRGKWMKTG